MLKRSSFKSHPFSLVLSLLTLVFLALGSTANAQSAEATQAQTQDEIVDVEITPNAASGSTSTTGESASGLCEQPDQWLFARTYKEGEMSFHGGKVWKVIKETKGDMPGQNKPPFWEHVTDHCSSIGR
ncbi:MAG: hypothetical protein ACTHWH_05220 [Marinobacter sp.]